jgi:hypothetical protein
MRNCVLAAVVAAATVTGAHGAHAQAQPPAPQPSTNWLLDAPNDTERFRLLQRYLRGFDQPMWEVGERYRAIFDALKLENYELALYHWDKIKWTIQNGYLKRPARKANAHAILLDHNWGEVNAAFQSKDKAKAWDGFVLARSSCMACHEAEKVAFVNNQPLFIMTEPPSSR